MNLGRPKKEHIIVPVEDPTPTFVPEEWVDEPRRVGFQPDREPERVPAPA